MSNLAAAGAIPGALVRALSVVIPVYNSEQTLGLLISELTKELPKVAAEWEIILVNDGSRDGSWNCVERLTHEHSAVRGICLMRNYGQHNALLAGIRSARFDTVVTMDDDLQHPPNQIPKLLAKLDEGCDVVYGVPNQEQHGIFRDLASQMTKLVLQKTMGAETARRISAFRAFRTDVREAFSRYQGAFVSIDVLLTWGTSRFGSVEVQHDPRRAGISNYTIGKLIAHTANLVTGFSALPLQLASLIGFIFTLVGMAVFLLVLVRYMISGSSVPGFPFLASIIAIFSGAQLFAIGIIGEYLARVHFRLMDKPSYAIRLERKAGGDDPIP